MKIAVTGGAGFIGSRLVDALHERSDEVALWDKRTGQDLADLSAHYEHEIESFEPDVIVHLAGTCSTPGSVARPLETFTDTVTSAVTALEAARMWECPIIVTSSVKARDGRTPYGAAKRMVELWAREYGFAYDIPVVINRPGTVYGPGQEGSMESGWIAWFVKAQREGIKVTINGTGEQVRDLLHVDDYVRLLLMQIDSPIEFATGVHDVGGGWSNAISVNDMADYLGLEREYGPERYGDVLTYVGINDTPRWKPAIHWRDSETLRR